MGICKDCKWEQLQLEHWSIFGQLNHHLNHALCLSF